MHGLKADKLLLVLPPNEAHAEARILWEHQGQQLFFDVPVDELRYLMPSLTQVTAPQGPERTAIVVQALKASRNAGGELLLSLVDAAGTDTTFLLPPAAARRLSALLHETPHPLPGAEPTH